MHPVEWYSKDMSLEPVKMTLFAKIALLAIAVKLRVLPWNGLESDVWSLN